MQLELVERVAIWVALILSVVNFTISIFTLEISKEKFKPQLAISLDNLPPYTTEGQATVVQIKNDGGRDALLDGIEVEFKPVLDHPLTITELRNNRVPTNGVISEAIKLPDPVAGMNKVLVTVNYKFGWRGRQTGKSVIDYNYRAAG